jgi:AmiR/NasT family two-component response regulator
VARDIEQTLTKLGFDVVGTAQFANEAVAKAAETQPDLHPDGHQPAGQPGRH